MYIFVLTVCLNRILKPLPAPKQIPHTFRMEYRAKKIDSDSDSRIALLILSPASCMGLQVAISGAFIFLQIQPISDQVFLNQLVKGGDRFGQTLLTPAILNLCFSNVSLVKLIIDELWTLGKNVAFAFYVSVPQDKNIRH